MLLLEGVAIPVLLHYDVIQELCEGKEVVCLDLKELLSGYRYVDIEEFKVLYRLLNCV